MIAKSEIITQSVTTNIFEKSNLVQSSITGAIVLVTDPASSTATRFKGVVVYAANHAAGYYVGYASDFPKEVFKQFKGEIKLSV